MMDKTKNNKLISIADKELQTSSILNVKEGSIKDSYNGSVAALSVSVAMSGLRPTLAIYYHKEDRKNVLEIITKMLLNSNNEYYKFGSVRKDGVDIRVTNAESLLKYAFYCNDEQLKVLQRNFIDCAIALKQVIRTYKLKKDEND